MKLVVLSALLAIAGANELVKTTSKPPPKRTYVCPPDFIRLGNKCYFFSNTSVKWDDAFFNCNDMHSTLAIIRSKYQHKLLRNVLTSNSKYSAHLERWIGGRYDWTKHEWLWGASGKPIDYNGFPTPPPTNITVMESFQWHCIILDPKMKYSWNHKSCYEQKQYVCQTKLKNVTRKQKNKLRKLYNNKKLNEVPVPEITNNAISNANSNTTSKTAANAESNDINNAAFATRPKNLKKRKVSTELYKTLLFRMLCQIIWNEPRLM
ncbi:putative C-type lectin [Trypoxylus dichotomus]